MSSIPLMSRSSLGPPMFPPSEVDLSEAAQEQKLSGNGDRETIVVGAGLFDGENERVYTVH